MLEFWCRIFDFTGKTTRRTFFTGVLMLIPTGIVMLFVEILIAFLRSVPEYQTSLLMYIYGFAMIVGLFSSMVRRLNDAGYSARSLWWFLVPGIGGIAILARLCMKSKEQTS